jgi:hypothetical protein
LVKKDAPFSKPLLIAAIREGRRRRGMVDGCMEGKRREMGEGLEKVMGDGV